MQTTAAINPAGSPKFALVQDEERVAREHQRRVGHERRERRAALDRVHRRRAALRANVVELGRDRETRDRDEVQRQRVRGRDAEGRGVRFEEAGTDERAERECEGGEARPSLPVRAAQQQDPGEHAEEGVEADGPGRARGQHVGRQVVGQREPQHGADAERDERRLEPELRAEGLAPGCGQEADRRHGGTGEECELQGIHRRLQDGKVEGARRRHGEDRGKLEAEREREPSPGVAAPDLEIVQARASHGDDEGCERRDDDGDEPRESGGVLDAEHGSERRTQRQGDAKQHEPGRSMVEPRRQGFAQPTRGRLVAVQLH